MSNEEKVYLKGSAKEISFNNGGSIMKLSFNIDNLKEIAEQYANEKGWFNVDVKQRQSEDDYGNTHYVQLNTYKPEKKDSPEGEGTDLPF